MTLPPVIRQLRPHQWVKNFLLFIPIGLAHKVAFTSEFIAVCISFAAFSLCASVIYTVNDIVDVESDRNHPTKRRRPIASGALSVATATTVAVVLMAAAFVLAAFWTNSDFLVWLVVYVVITTLYSFWLKQVVLVDVIVLALLYVLRIEAGAAAAQVVVSPWLLAFSLFVFSSLAFLKRYTELLQTIEQEGRAITGRGYVVGDAGFVMVAGIALGLIALLVLTLYINGPDVQVLYAHPTRLWYVVPFLLYWITHMWLTSHRGRMHDDPIMFAIKDLRSYIVAVVSIAIVFWASIP